MGENEKLSLWYMGEPIEDVGIATTLTCAPELPDKAIRVWSGSQRPISEDYAKVASNDAKFLIPPYIRDGFIVVDEMTPLDITKQGYTLSCRTNSQQLQKAVERLREELSKPFPILFKKPTKRNKHYKPKFTL